MDKLNLDACLQRPFRNTGTDCFVSCIVQVLLAESPILRHIWERFKQHEHRQNSLDDCNECVLYNTMFTDKYRVRATLPELGYKNEWETTQLRRLLHATSSDAEKAQIPIHTNGEAFAVYYRLSSIVQLASDDPLSFEAIERFIHNAEFLKPTTDFFYINMVGVEEGGYGSKPRTLTHGVLDRQIHGYEVFAVVMNTSSVTSASGGHYYTLRKQNNTWFEVNDSLIQSLNTPTFPYPYKKHHIAMIFYKKAQHRDQYALFSFLEPLKDNPVQRTNYPFLKITSFPNYDKTDCFISTAIQVLQCPDSILNNTVLEFFKAHSVHTISGCVQCVLKTSMRPRKYTAKAGPRDISYYENINDRYAAKETINFKNDDNVGGNTADIRELLATIHPDEIASNKNGDFIATLNRIVKMCDPGNTLGVLFTLQPPTNAYTGMGGAVMFPAGKPERKFTHFIKDVDHSESFDEMIIDSMKRLSGIDVNSIAVSGERVLASVNTACVYATYPGWNQDKIQSIIQRNATRYFVWGVLIMEGGSPSFHFTFAANLSSVWYLYDSHNITKLGDNIQLRVQVGQYVVCIFFDIITKAPPPIARSIFPQTPALSAHPTSTTNPPRNPLGSLTAPKRPADADLHQFVFQCL